jgi:hypothetical protein
MQPANDDYPFVVSSFAQALGSVVHSKLDGLQVFINQFP